MGDRTEDPRHGSPKYLREHEKHQSNLRWEEPIDRRLLNLVRLAQEAGLNASRSEVVAALILAASTDPSELVALIISYRTAEASKVDVQGAAIVDISGRRRPGRLPRQPRPPSS